MLSEKEKREIQAEIRRLEEIIYANPNNPAINDWKQRVKNLKALLRDGGREGSQFLVVQLMNGFGTGKLYL